jgi:DNA polymerase I-like protein with 3'-5' exonuclease and polymerase domains
MLVSLDIETACAAPLCSGKGCEHALTAHTARITVVGLFFRRPRLADYFATIRDLSELVPILDGLGDYQLTGHKLQFDLKMLAHHGVSIPVERWGFDTQIAAALSTEKVPAAYLREYENRRAVENEKLPKGYSHRPGSLHSLKVLAPYWLKVESFWEDPTNHDNDEYLRKDCQYAYDLVPLLRAQLADQGLLDFFERKLMPWTRMLLEAEIAGIPIDLAKLEEMKEGASRRANSAKTKLDELWAPAYQARLWQEKTELSDHYQAKKDAAQAKLKKPTPDKLAATEERYRKLYSDAATKLDSEFNLNSPAQLTWLLRDYLGLDISGFDGDESTGKEILQRLAGEGREDIKTFLEYRKYSKQSSAFFPTYLELQHNGIIRCNFNPDGTRTGRLSSSRPNLQQVPGELHQLFVAPAGMLLNSSDMSAIEAKLIAYYSEDPNLCELVMSGQDFHGFNVVNAYFPELKADGITPFDIKKESAPGQRFHIHRKLSKELGYALFYGAGAGRVRAVAQKHGFSWTMRECTEKVRRFHRVFAKVFEFKEALDHKAGQGDMIKGLLGRAHRYPQRDEIFMRCFNTLVQCSASDLVLNSGYRIKTKFKEAGIVGGPRLFVHDEIVSAFEALRRAEAEQIITSSMVDYQLDTQFGPIPLQSESKTSTCWAK